MTRVKASEMSASLRVTIAKAIQSAQCEGDDRCEKNCTTAVIPAGQGTHALFPSFFCREHARED